MSKKLFVGGLAWATTDDTLRAAFESFGTIVEAKVIMERDTGRSRGFGFVSYTDEESAKAACAAMNGQTLEGRAIRVNEADDSPRKPAGGPRNYGAKKPAPQRNADAPARDNASPSPRYDNAPSSSYQPYADDGAGRRDRRKDKKKRDRFDDDDRWG